MSEKTTPPPIDPAAFVASNANYGLIVESPPVTTKEDAQRRIMGLYQAVAFYFQQVGGINWACFHLVHPGGIQGEEFEVMIQKAGKMTTAQMLSEECEVTKMLRRERDRHAQTIMCQANDFARLEQVEVDLRNAHNIQKERADALYKRCHEYEAEIEKLKAERDTLQYRAHKAHERCDEYHAQILKLEKQIETDKLNAEAATGMARERAGQDKGSQHRALLQEVKARRALDRHNMLGVKPMSLDAHASWCKAHVELNRNMHYAVLATDEAFPVLERP